MKFQAALLRLFGSNALLTAANLLRDVSVASIYGAAVTSDVFFLAISIPVLLMMVNGNAFRGVAVPALGRVLASDETAFPGVAQRLIFVNAGGIAAVAILLFVAALFVSWMTPAAGQVLSPAVGSFVLAIVPMYAVAALIEAVQGPLQVRGHYLLPGLLRLGLPLGIIAGAVASGGRSIYGTAVGGVIGTVVALAAAILLLARDRMLPVSRGRALPEEMRRRTADGYRALVVASFITGVNPVVDQWMAGPLGAGSVSLLGYANRLIVGVAGLVLAALGPLLLIRFSSFAGAGDDAAIRRTYRLFTRVTFWLGGLATLGVWLMADLAIALLYQRGAFRPEDGRVVTQLMDIYALQFPFYWSAIAAGSLVSALSRNRFFVAQGVFVLLLNVVGDLVLRSLLGLHGMAVSTVIVCVSLSVTVNGYLVWNRLVDLSRREFLEAGLVAALLAACGFCIWRFGLQLGPGKGTGQMAAAALLLLAFAGAAGYAARDAIKELRRPVTNPVR